MNRLNEQQRAAISRGYCPDCSHPGFRLGPRGGAAINIECMGGKCGSRFNVLAISGAIPFGERIERGSEWPSNDSMERLHIVQAIVAMLPNDKAAGLNTLEQARQMVTRFKRS